MMQTEEIRADLLNKLGATYAEAYPKELERQFPQIVAKIAQLWGSDSMEPYFESLLVTQRSGRMGFPTAVASELLRLFSIYHHLGLAKRPTSQTGDVWNWVDHVGYFDKKTDLSKR